MRPEQVRDLLSGLLAGQQAPDGSGAVIESLTVARDHRLVVTCSDHTRAVVTVGVYEAQR
jgi:hypothetical protein